MLLDPGVTDTMSAFTTQIRIWPLSFICKIRPVIWVMSFLALQGTENPPALTCKMTIFFVDVVATPPVSRGAETGGTETFPL